MQIIGFTVYFEVTHYLIRKEIKSLIKSGVPEEERISFEFTDHELESLTWLKKNEFQYGEHLYDVLERFELPNGNTLLKCISDTQEKVLFADLSRTTSANLGDDHHPTPLSNMMKILKTPVTLDAPVIPMTLVWQEEKKVDHFAYREMASQFILDEMVNPPDVMC